MSTSPSSTSEPVLPVPGSMAWFTRLDEFPELDKNYKHSIEIVVDRLVNDEDSRSRWPRVSSKRWKLPKATLSVLNADSNEDK